MHVYYYVYLCLPYFPLVDQCAPGSTTIDHMFAIVIAAIIGGLVFIAGGVYLCKSKDYKSVYAPIA